MEDPQARQRRRHCRKLLETPYWDLVRNMSAADPITSTRYRVSRNPGSQAERRRDGYSIYAKIGAADYAEQGRGDFCATATMVGSIGKTTTSITLENGIDLDIVNSGGYAVIDDEYVLLSGLDVGTNTATISRGVLDTVPAAHAAGARIWFADGQHRLQRHRICRRRKPLTSNCCRSPGRASLTLPTRRKIPWCLTSANTALSTGQSAF